MLIIIITIDSKNEFSFYLMKKKPLNKISKYFL